MFPVMQKLMIIRGNSGSGKSTVAKEVRKLLDGKVALIEQDYFRRIVLKEKDTAEHTAIIDLLDQTVRLAISRGYIVILEGILSSEKYRGMLNSLANDFRSQVFYIDVSFGETLIRHNTKPNKHEFGAEEMKNWYLEKDYLCRNDEIIIREQSSLKKTVKMIVEAAKGHPD
jgi:predicted ABC-type ATPase